MPKTRMWHSSVTSCSGDSGCNASFWPGTSWFWPELAGSGRLGSVANREIYLYATSL